MVPTDIAGVDEEHDDAGTKALVEALRARRRARRKAKKEKRKAAREITGEDYENLGGCLLWDAFPGGRQKSLGQLRDKWAEEVDWRQNFPACVHRRQYPCLSPIPSRAP